MFKMRVAISIIFMVIMVSFLKGQQLDPKMHFPQMPDSMGWDVNATWPKVLADDWMCTETGWIKDFHFWGSWRQDIEGTIDSFLLSIHHDIPANESIPYSHPGIEIWSRIIPESMVAITPINPIYIDLSENWFDPNTGEILLNDHLRYFRYDIILPPNWWLMQDSGMIYWLNISAFVSGDTVSPDRPMWGWKSSRNHWNDDAVYTDTPGYNWNEMFEPMINGLYGYSPGDVDGDGILSGGDLVLITKYLQGNIIPAYSIPGSNPPFYPAADVNGDCIINALDFFYLRNYIMGVGPYPVFCPQYPPADTTQSLDLAFYVTGDTINPETGGLGGAKFYDKNWNCIWDSGEPGLAGWTIELYNGGKLYMTATTGTGGIYSFPILPVGTYTIKEVPKASWVQTCPPPGVHNVVISPNLSVIVDFGNYHGWTNQEHYYNHTQTVAYDLTKILEGHWNILGATRIPFPYCTSYYDPILDITVIHWWGASVYPGQWAFACFTTDNYIKPILTSWWTDIFGNIIDYAGPIVTVNPAVRADTSVSIKVTNNWLGWVGSGWPLSPQDHPGGPMGSITGTNIKYAISTHEYSMEELNESLFQDTSLTWNPLPDFTLNYGDSMAYNLGVIPTDNVVVWVVDLTGATYNARDFKQFTVGLLPQLESFCEYLIGDINGDGQRLGSDVTYGVRYFKGVGTPPRDSCFMDSTGTYLYVACDCNGNCEFRGSDITRLVAYFRGNANLNCCHWFPTSLPPVYKDKEIYIKPGH